MGVNMNVKELMSELQSKVVLDIKQGQILCPDCKGLRFKYTEKEDSGFITNCTRCHNGKLYLCPDCGDYNQTDYCNCTASWNRRNAESEAKKIATATKVDIKDYNGMLKSLIYEERVIDKDEFYDEYFDNFDADSPKYVWAMKPYLVVRPGDLDVYEYILRVSEDGYEDMYERLDIDSPLLVAANKLIQEWYKENESMMYAYAEDYSIMVDISSWYEDLFDANKDYI